MSSVVDICNLALGHLGDSATVASIDPPEGSAQADHCAAFYPQARDTLLEMHPWGFATKRATLALLTNPTTTWSYCYAVPNDALKLLAVIASDALDDYSIGNRGPGSSYSPQPYAAETLEDGTSVILTNQVQAVLRYASRVTDSTKFSPLFVATLARMLASYLAGPVLKGDAGRAESKAQLAFAMALLGQAKTSDANQRQNKAQHNVAWMAGR